MCTLSWCRAPTGAGYTLWFNRDERHPRAPEQPPSQRCTNDVAWLAPTDPDRGGTWLMVNAHGLTACLLNDYGTPWSLTVLPAGRARPSRGWLVPATAAGATAEAAIAAVRELVGPDHAPFELFAIDATGGAARLHWDGTGAHETMGEAVIPPASSSSFEPARVVAARRARYPRSPDPAALRAYHFYHDATAAAESVNMSRPDAATRSICEIRVFAATVELDYAPQAWPGAPAPTSERRTFSLLRPKPQE